jgi:hypothetical protein
VHFRELWIRNSNIFLLHIINRREELITNIKSAKRLAAIVEALLQNGSEIYNITAKQDFIPKNVYKTKGYKI